MSNSIIDLTQSPSSVNGAKEFNLTSTSTYTNNEDVSLSTLEHIQLPFKVEKAMAPTSLSLLRCAKSQPSTKSEQSILGNDVQLSSFAVSMPNFLPFDQDRAPISSSMTISKEDTKFSGHSLFSSVTENMAHESSTDLAWTLPIEEIQRFFGIDPEKYKIVTKYPSHN